MVKPSSRAIVVLVLAFIIFLILKLSGIIPGWNWWLVASPLLAIITGIGLYVLKYFGTISYKRNKYKKEFDSKRP